jgi:hypothetical protein
MESDLPGGAGSRVFRLFEIPRHALPFPALEAATTEPRRGRLTDGAARGLRDSRGPGTQQNLPQAILSAVMGGRPIDPAQAARRMYLASRQFEARMAGGED